MRKRALAVLAAFVVISCGGSAPAGADDTSNDRVLRGDHSEYIEVFKKDSAGGRKNYLYTVTEFKDQWGRECTVVSGDSEQTIALDCDQPGEK